MYNITQGEDLVVEIPVIDDDNDKFDLTNANAIRVALSVKGLVIQKYLDETRETTIEGYGSLTIDTTNNNQINLSLTRDQSKVMPVGDVTATVLIDMPDNTLTNKRYEFSYVIANITKGTLNNETL